MTKFYWSLDDMGGFVLRKLGVQTGGAYGRYGIPTLGPDRVPRLACLTPEGLKFAYAPHPCPCGCERTVETPRMWRYHGENLFSQQCVWNMKRRLQLAKTPRKDGRPRKGQIRETE
jgi:hypothetical protein